MYASRVCIRVRGSYLVEHRSRLRSTTLVRRLETSKMLAKGHRLITGNSHCARSFPSEPRDKHLSQHGPNNVNSCTQLKATCDLQSPHSSMALQELAKSIQRRKRGHATTTCITCSTRDGCVKSSCSSAICAVMDGRVFGPMQAYRHLQNSHKYMLYVYSADM